MVTEVSGCNYTNHSLAFTLEDSDLRETVQPSVLDVYKSQMSTSAT